MQFTQFKVRISQLNLNVDISFKTKKRQSLRNMFKYCLPTFGTISNIHSNKDNKSCQKRTETNIKLAND